MNPIKNDSPDNGSPQPKNTLPFNLADALVGKPVIHEYKRTKAVQVIHADRLPQARNVLVVFADGAYDLYTAAGQSADGCVRLWMERTGEPVPFTIESWKKGWKPVYRDGTLPREVRVFETASSEDQPVVSIDANGYLNRHGLDGSYLHPDHGGTDGEPADLLLIPPTQD